MAIVKLLHVLCILLWMGSLLMITRFMSFLPKEEPTIQQRLSHLIRRVYLFIDLPAMILTITFGLILLLGKDTNWKAPWLHLKLTCVFMLIICDICTGWNMSRKSHRRARAQILHGLVGLTVIAILAAVYILKPSV